MGGAIYRGKSPSGAWIHIYPNLAWIRIYPDFPFLICLLRKSPTELVSIDCEHEGLEIRTDTSVALGEDDPDQGGAAWRWQCSSGHRTTGSLGLTRVG
jgi:hypothetical protein